MKRWLALALLLPCAACGVYSVGYTPVHGIDSVAVPIFDNRTLRRGYEYDLTARVRQRILDQTPLQLVPERSAPAVLLGSITGVYEEALVPNLLDTAPPQVSSVIITVEVSLVDPRTGTTMVGGPDGKPLALTERESFVAPFAQTVDSAADRALRKLSERIVDLLEEGWGREER